MLITIAVTVGIVAAVIAVCLLLRSTFNRVIASYDGYRPVFLHRQGDRRNYIQTDVADEPDHQGDDKLADDKFDGQ